VTRESALEAIQHVAQSNTPGRTIQAARMLVAAQARATGTPQNVEGFDLSLAAAVEYDPQSCINGAKWQAARATGTQGASELLPLPIALSTVQVFRLSIVEAAIPAEFIYSDKQMLEYGQQCYQLALQRKGEPAEGGAFPERDLSKPAEQQGLFRKFDVRRVDGSDQPGGKHHGCRYYVLDLNHDQHAPAAMRAYAAVCRATHPHLAADIEAEFGAAPQASREVPEGWKPVPAEPSKEMIEAGARYLSIMSLPDREAGQIYGAMLAAAPSPASAEDGEKRDAADALGLTLTRWMHDGSEMAISPDGDWVDYDEVRRLLAAAQLDGSQKAGGAA
jgi:hypothetical protein